MPAFNPACFNDWFYILRTQEFDVSEIEKLFSANVPKPADSDGKSGGRRKSVGSKADKIHLVFFYMNVLEI